MNTGVSLFGCGLERDVLYQLVALTWASSMSLTGSFYPTVDLCALNCTTGDLIPAWQMPVKYRPGWLIQGKRSGPDTAVTNAQVKGYMVPPEVSSTFAATMPLIPNTESTGWRVLNGAISGYTKIYPLFAPGTGSNISGLKFHHDMATLYCDDGSVGERSISVDANGHKVFTWVYEKYPYRRELTVTCTGNIYHMKRKSDSLPNLTEGSYVSDIIYLPTGKVTRATGIVTGFKLFAFSVPKDLSSLSQGLILNALGQDEDLLSQELINLSVNADNGNTEWETCQKAVDAFKYFNGATLEMMRDAYHIKQLAPPLTAFATLAKPQSWAQIFLWFKYGILPTISDAIEVAKAFEKCKKKSWLEIAEQFAKRSTRYASTYEQETLRSYTVTHQCNARVTARPNLRIENFLESLYLFLMSLNIGISARNVWELVPYSFVVDWFVNTAKFMSFADWQTQTCLYDLDQLIISHKRTVRVSASDYFANASGVLDLITYDRTIHKQFPPSSFRIGILDPSSHWLEGTALVVSAIR